MKKVFLVLVLIAFTSSVFGSISATRNKRFSVGNAVAETYEVTITSATGGSVKTGMSNLFFCEYSSSTTNDSGIVYKNSLTASTTEDDGGAAYILLEFNASSEAGDLFCLGTP